jgi:hypothetical protein
VTTIFDPQAGVLRVRHAALSVLARLATEPTDTRLHDHDVAPLVAELRGARLIGPGGIHPDAAPLASAIGDAHTVADVVAHDHGTVRGTKVWVDVDLAVVGVATAEDPHTYDLMADWSAAAPSLIAEVVGLGVAPEPPVRGDRTVRAEVWDDLLAADASVVPGEVAAAVGARTDDPWTVALAAGLRGAAFRWRLAAKRDGAHLCDIDVLDAGRSGLWLAERDGAVVRVRATDAAAVVAHLGRLADVRAAAPRPGAS